MSWDYELARALRATGKKQAGSLLTAEVERAEPLTFSLAGGGVMAPPLRLIRTDAAAGRAWAKGDQAVCYLTGKALIVLDRVEG